MKRLTALATLCLGLAATGWGLAAAEPRADGPAPDSLPDCPYCGSWALVGSDTDGAGGERIVIGPQSVTLPTCGEFRIDEIDAMRWSEDAGRRAYRAVLRLRPAASEPVCASVDEGAVRLEVSVVDNLPGDAGGSAEFNVYRGDSDAPRLSAVGTLVRERIAGALPRP